MQNFASKSNTLLHPKEVAQLLDVTPGTVRRWAHQGSIEAVRLGGPTGHLRISRSALDNFLRPVISTTKDAP
jgi:excisionase family DNA binding protein